MNVDSSMCASSGKATQWEQIDWPQCERQVRRLQARIVKATREGRWGKVQTLQRLLAQFARLSFIRSGSGGNARATIRLLIWFFVFRSIFILLFSVLKGHPFHKRLKG